MKIKSKNYQGYLDFLHYSRIQLIVLSITMTATNSIVLFGEIIWQPIVIVGLSTYVTYTLDNLLDWSGEKHMLQTIKSIWNQYQKWSRIIITLSLVIILLLSLEAGSKFLVILTGIGLFSGLTILLTRQSGWEMKKALFYFGERLAVSLTWTLVSVVVPIVYSGFDFFRPQSFMVIGFVWQISWIVAIIYKTTSVTAMQTRSNPNKIESITLPGEHLSIKLLKYLCVTASLLATIDVILGYFPWYNLIVLIVPIIQFIILLRWDISSKVPLLYCNLFFLITILSTLLITLTYFAIT